MSKEAYWRRLVTSGARLILVLFLGLPATFWTQKQQASWSDLNRLTAGQGIEVVESSMKHHGGEFIDVTDEVLMFQEGGIRIVSNSGGTQPSSLTKRSFSERPASPTTWGRA